METKNKIPGDSPLWRLVLSLSATLSYLLVVVAKVSYGDLVFRSQNQSENLTYVTNLTPPPVSSPLYFLALPLFLAFLFLPQIARYLEVLVGKTKMFTADKGIVRLLYAFGAIMVFAITAYLQSENNMAYIYFFGGIALAFGLIEGIWANPFIKSVSPQKTLDLPVPEDKVDSQEEFYDAQEILYKAQLELLKFEDQKWWRAFQFLWMILIAIVIAGAFTAITSVKTDDLTKRYAQTEVSVLFFAGALVFPPFVAYFVNKTNCAHSKMEEIYQKRKALLETKINLIQQKRKNSENPKTVI